MKVLGLIPARGGSKGIPGKNIKLLHGKPLIAYTITPALEVGLFDKVLVSTDQEGIALVARQLGAEAKLRPASLATDTSPTIDTVVHVLETYQKAGQLFDAVCLLQPTNPLRSQKVLKKCMMRFEASGADSLISVRQVPHEYNPHWTFEAKEEGSLLSIATGEKDIIPRRQELPKAYHRDGAVYLVKSEVVLNEKSLYGKSISFLDMTGEPHVNIDTLSDWQYAEKVLADS
ncbi:MAG: acylneuraminate cytidylyltransferase family protein [Roseivirga sp.]